MTFDSAAMTRNIRDLVGAVPAAAHPAAAKPVPTTTARLSPGRGRQGKRGILVHVDPGAGPTAETPRCRARTILVFGRKPGRSAAFQDERAGETEFTYGLSYGQWTPSSIPSGVECTDKRVDYSVTVRTI